MKALYFQIENMNFCIFNYLFNRYVLLFKAPLVPCKEEEEKKTLNHPKPPDYDFTLVGIFINS